MEKPLNMFFYPIPPGHLRGFCGALRTNADSIREAVNEDEEEVAAALQTPPFWWSDFFW